MHKELLYIPPSELHDYWFLVKPGLLEVKINSSDGWIEEDVYSSLRNGQSTLHIGFVDGEYSGFLVLSKQQGYDAMRLFVWCCYAKTEHDPIALFVDDLLAMARSIKARQITFGSKRRWEKRLKQYGFEPMTTIYAMEV